METNKEQSLKEFLPFWKKVKEDTRAVLTRESEKVHLSKGTSLHAGRGECSGLFLVDAGRIRAYIMTPEGKEVTLFRLLERDICIFSASCMMKNIQFDIYISAETDVEAVRIPTATYEKCSREEAAIAQFTNEVLGSRMSDVMWVLEQILFTSFDKRLANFLLEEAELEGTDLLTITHEQIASHLGSAREVVTRMLRYFSKEGWVEVKRGTILLKDKKKLEESANSHK